MVKFRAFSCCISSLIFVLLFFSDISAQTVSEKVLKKINASAYKSDTNNEDGVFVAQHQQTKKWGMFQAWSEKDIKQMIPMQYDSIDFFGFNAKMTGVWNKGNVGIFLSPWSFGEENAKQTVECLYDGYKIFEVEKTAYDSYSSYRKYFTYLAVQKDGLWAWIDWMTGELKTDFSYDLEKELMPYPDFEQEQQL